MTVENKGTMRMYAFVLVFTAVFILGCQQRLRISYTPYGLSKVDKNGNIKYIWSPFDDKWVYWKTQVNSSSFAVGLDRLPVTEYNVVSGRENYLEDQFNRSILRVTPDRQDEF